MHSPDISIFLGVTFVTFRLGLGQTNRWDGFLVARPVLFAVKYRYVGIQTIPVVQDDEEPRSFLRTKHLRRLPIVIAVGWMRAAKEMRMTEFIGRWTTTPTTALIPPPFVPLQVMHNAS